MTLKPVGAAVIEEIVDTVFLPLITQPAHPRPSSELSTTR
jgi:hypothetical protein